MFLRRQKNHARKGAKLTTRHSKFSSISTLLPLNFRRRLCPFFRAAQTVLVEEQTQEKFLLVVSWQPFCPAAI